MPASFKISNWYWIVGADADNVWSSAKATSVPASDPDYAAWFAAGNQPSVAESMEDVKASCAFSFPPGTLWTYAADARYRKAGGGVTITSLSPVMFLTDPISRNAINSGYDYLSGPAPTSRANQAPSPIIQWKMSDGSFLPLDKAKITTLMNNVSDFVQDCFAVESQVVAGIDAGTITSLAQVDEAFAALSNVYP